MIPKNISRENVLDSIKLIENEGIPKSRLSRKYNVVYNGKLYPPKYLISVANKLANNIDLPPYEFNGGIETNTFLEKLGFEIIPYKKDFSNDVFENQTKIVTVTIENFLNYYPSNDERLELLNNIIVTFSDSSIILLPAGFFYLDKQTQKQINKITDSISSILKYNSMHSVICFGIDCDDGNDQLAVAVSSKGIIAMGRKFYPTSYENGVIRIANKFDELEMGYTRFFEIDKKRFYLAVCYDVFGIRHHNIENPNVDAILILAHQFWNRGEGPSGDVDFARKGFAGASRQWNCPAFGTAVFFNRKIPYNWPTGVLWYDQKKSIKHFNYKDNELHWNRRNEIKVCQEKVLYYEYKI